MEVKKVSKRSMPSQCSTTVLYPQRYQRCPCSVNEKAEQSPLQVQGRLCYSLSVEPASQNRAGFVFVEKGGAEK